MDKPITLQTEELKNNIVEIINNSKLPPVLLDYIMKDLYNEIHILYINQVTQDKNEYLHEKDREESAK